SGGRRRARPGDGGPARLPAAAAVGAVPVPGTAQGLAARRQARVADGSCGPRVGPRAGRPPPAPLRRRMADRDALADHDREVGDGPNLGPRDPRLTDPGPLPPGASTSRTADPREDR